MSEREAVERVEEPSTVASLTADLRDLGITSGETLIVHASLQSLGWVAGGPQAIVDALRRVVTDRGTLVMPTHTGQYTDPEDWSDPPVPTDWVPTIRDSMPAYRPAVTPTRGMGAIPECFRTYPDVIRSEHPIVSFAAGGSAAATMVSDHGFADGLGEASPIGRVYEQDGRILLLGTGHATNTSLHLAEYRADLPTTRVERRAPIRADGERIRVSFSDIEHTAEDFPALGAAFERQVGLSVGSVGAAEARLASQRSMVDFAVDWMEANR